MFLFAFTIFFTLNENLDNIAFGFFAVGFKATEKVITHQRTSQQETEKELKSIFVLDDIAVQTKRYFFRESFNLEKEISILAFATFIILHSQKTSEVEQKVMKLLETSYLCGLFILPNLRLLVGKLCGFIKKSDKFELQELQNFKVRELSNT